MEEIQPEVRVHSVRRRREEPPPPEPPTHPNVRNWLIYLSVTGLIAGLMLDGFLNDRPKHPSLPAYSEARDVKSEILAWGDSLQVVVSWDLSLSVPEGRPDSIRVKVVPEGSQHNLASMQAPNQLSDTTYVPAPLPGHSARGISCVSAMHPQAPPTEACTPWQYVRPAAMAQTDAGIPSQIVIRPGGLQVDPDVGGKCAAWQQAHPNDSLWTKVNRTAVPDCTGPNGKPTVAQFCAFAVLPDGRRVKTANSAGSRYCDELFVEWTRERTS